MILSSSGDRSGDEDDGEGWCELALVDAVVDATPRKSVAAHQCSCSLVGSVSMRSHINPCILRQHGHHINAHPQGDTLPRNRFTHSSRNQRGRWSSAPLVRFGIRCLFKKVMIKLRSCDLQRVRVRQNSRNSVEQLESLPSSQVWTHPDASCALGRRFEKEEEKKEEKLNNRENQKMATAGGEDPWTATGSHGHYFLKKNFHKPSYCHHCSDLVWGLLGQGYVCEGIEL